MLNSTRELRQLLQCQVHGKPLGNTSYAKPKGSWQIRNTHSCPNPMVIWPSESSALLSANAQKLFRFILPWHVNICTSLNMKLLCSMLSDDLDALLCDWQPRKQVAAFLSLLPRAVSSTACAYSALTEVFDVLKETGKKRIEFGTSRAQAAVTALKWRFFEAGCSEKEVERFPKLFWESTEWVPNRDFLSPEIYQIGQD